MGKAVKWALIKTLMPWYDPEREAAEDARIDAKIAYAEACQLLPATVAPPARRRRRIA